MYEMGFSTTEVVRAFTTPEEANKYSDLLNAEKEPYTTFYVEECGLYNKIEDINE